MKPKKLVMRWCLLAACLALGAMLLAPAARSQGPEYNRITISIQNQSQKDVVIMGGMLAQGRWGQGRQPIAQTRYSAYSAMGPFATISAAYGQGNGGSLYLNVGNVTWHMPWNGQPQLRVSLNDPNLRAQINGPLPDPDKQHVAYNITISQQ